MATKDIATIDEVVKIPRGMEKFFGGSGQMVRPSVGTVVKLIEQIPHGKIATLESLRSRIARKSKVFAACPASTMKSILQAIEAKEEFCYWRLVKNSGQLVNQFPGGIKRHAKQLEQEGIGLDQSKKVPVVEDFSVKLHVFK